MATNWGLAPWEYGHGPPTLAWRAALSSRDHDHTLNAPRIRESCCRPGEFNINFAHDFLRVLGRG